jgi:hypothetical protein
MSKICRDISSIVEEVVTLVVSDGGVGVIVWFMICHVRSLTMVFSTVFLSCSAWYTIMILSFPYLIVSVDWRRPSSLFSVERRYLWSAHCTSVVPAMIVSSFVCTCHQYYASLPIFSYIIFTRPFMWPFIKVNEFTISWCRVTSRGCSPLGEAAGPNRNVAGMFASLLGYIPRFVPYHVSEDGDISSSDRSASALYALFVTGTCGAGCWWVWGAILRGGEGKMHEKHVKTVIS